MTRAVVLAAGRGARMRAAAPDVILDPAQGAAADQGLKGLVPFHGHVFLSYVLTSLADAGYNDVCLVTGPGSDPVRTHFERLTTRRLRLSFAVQEAPLGSAHALLAAEAFSAGSDVIVLNSDNRYPAEALRALRGLAGSGLIGFRPDGLLAGNIDRDRLTGYAIVEMDETGMLRNIIEKPDAARLAAAGGQLVISMTCWRFGPGIFDAIRATPRSARGEFEIPDAVRIAMRTECFEVIPLSVPVLDLSQRGDIPRVGKLLDGGSVDL
ncbi:MAG: sugar phosphate nucleotidyltransferase [Longimicrobiales bacterium]